MGESTEMTQSVANDLQWELHSMTLAKLCSGSPYK